MGGGTSEYVRNELRAAVEARSVRAPDLHNLQPPELDSLVTFDMTPSGSFTFINHIPYILYSFRSIQNCLSFHSYAIFYKFYYYTIETVKRCW